MTVPTSGWERLRWALWVMLLVSVPVTSFPYFPFPRAFVEALVRPLGLYPLGGLILLEILVRDVPRRRLPRLLAPMLAFAAVAVASTAISLLDPAPELRDQVPLSRALRGVITLAIGLAFLLATWRMASTWDRILASARWLVLGLSISLAWGLLQGSRLIFRWPYYAPLNAVQRIFSTWDLNPSRISGLTYEPSWFADQLAVLFFPLLIASLLSGSRIVVRRKWGWLVDGLLLFGGILGLALSYSRGGLLTVIVSTVVGLGLALVVRPPRRSGLRAAEGSVTPPGRRRGAKFAGRLGAGLALLGTLWLAFGRLAARNEYFSLLWEGIGKLGDLPAYFLSVGASTRYALAVAAWEVFAKYPVLGVGLGQSGFYLLNHMPAWALDRNPEMAFLLLPTSWTFPNPKNLWTRLLAETGLVGLLPFLIFLGLLAAGSLVLLSRASPHRRQFGVFGVMALPAILLSGTSLDSLALPTMWIALGLIVASIEALKLEGESGEVQAVPRLADTIPPEFDASAS